jgi:Family of unknown function (DUF5706)
LICKSSPENFSLLSRMELSIQRRSLQPRLKKLMKEEQKYLLDKIIDRFDFYIDTVNAKVAFIITLDTFILGAVSLNFRQVKSGISNTALVWIITGAVLVILLGVGMSLYLSLQAVVPYLVAKPKTKKVYDSLIFFGSVSKMSVDDFTQAVENVTSETLQDDLTNQAYVLASALSKKFETLDKSIFWTIYFVVIPVVCLALLLVFAG